MNGAICLVAILALVGCNRWETYEGKETYTLDASGLDTFIVKQDEGEVTITGVENSDEITVDATFSVLGEEMSEAELFSQENMALQLTSEGSVGSLTGEITRDNKQEQGYLHLNIKVPNDLLLDYRQSDGQLEIFSMKNNIQLQHGAGPLFLEDIEGDVQLTDGAGTATFTNVSGNVTMNKNAGKTTVTQSKGDLSVIAGSGDVVISDHKGDISLRSGSGDVEIESIVGNVTILEDSSGTATISNVTGTITQP